MCLRSTSLVVCMGLVLVLAFTCQAADPVGAEAPSDWPQWRGPQQDGISRETGLLKSWPEEGPQELWRVALGKGFSAVSVVGANAYTMYSDGDDEHIVCLDIGNGKTL